MGYPPSFVKYTRNVVRNRDPYMLLKDGTAELTADWDVGSYKITALTFESDQTTGTAPIAVASTTVCSNLNADQVDGLDSTDIVLVDGSQALTANWDVGSYTVTALRFISDQATGTSPFSVSSTTVVTNLNADQVDGKDSTDIVLVDGSQGLGANWDAGSYKITALTFESDQTTGTAPIAVASTTVCTNLNADQVDGKDSTDIVLVDGTQGLSANWDVGAYKITALTFESDQATGTAPIAVASTTVCTNLNADQVDGKDSTDLVLVDGSQELSADWDVGAHKITAETFESDVAIGTIPLAITSTTKCTNLNADQVDGLDSTDLVLVDGSQPLTASWDVGAYTITALTFTSDQATGTAPFTVASTTVVTNLNADQVDGLDSTDLVKSDDASTTNIRSETITLNGVTGHYTEIGFQSDDAAVITGVNAATDFSGVGDGGTILIDTDGIGDETATFNCAAGYHTGAQNPIIDMTASPDTNMKILVDGDAGGAQEITMAWAGCNSGALVAAQIQTKIQALGGVYASVTCTYNGAPVTDYYLITSNTEGTGSSVVITPGDTDDCTNELKLGTANGGVSTAGTGDCITHVAVTVDEMVTLINGDMSNCTASNAAGTLTITSNTTGGGSSLVAGAGTLNTTAGIPNTEADYGVQGMGYASDMANANYFVQLTLNGDATPADMELSATNRATSGFRIYCETDTATNDVDILVIGVSA